MQTYTLSDKNNRIPWDHNKFDQNRIILLRTERSINSNAISENIGPEINICKGVSQLIGTLSSATLAVLLAPLKYRYVQKQQKDELRTFPSYKKQIVLSSQSRAEIQCWVHIL